MLRESFQYFKQLIFKDTQPLKSTFLQKSELEFRKHKVKSPDFIKKLVAELQKTSLVTEENEGKLEKSKTPVLALQHDIEVISKIISQHSGKKEKIDQIKKDPTILLGLPIPLNPALFEELSPVSLERLNASYLKDKKLLLSFFNLPHLDDKILDELSDAVSNIQINIEKTKAIFFIIEKSKKLLAPIIGPDLLLILENLLQRTVVESTRKAETRYIDTFFFHANDGAGFTDKGYHLLIGTDSENKYGHGYQYQGLSFDSSFSHQVINTAHELIHLLVFELLESKFPIPKSYKTLRTVFFEAFSLWAEAEVYRGIVHNTNKEEKVDLKKIKKKRFKYLRDGLDGTIGVGYARGALLVLKWRKKGWRLSDLPQLLEASKEVFKKNGLTLQDLATLEIDTPLYSKVIEEIEELIPKAVASHLEDISEEP